MIQHPIPVTLSETDRASLQTFIHAGRANARSFTRAHALLKAVDGWTDTQICEAFGISRNTPASPAARRIFGKELTHQAVERLLTVLRGWGYQQRDLTHFTTCVCLLLL